MPVNYNEYSKTLTQFDFLKEDVQCLKDKMGEGIGFADYEGYTLIGEYKIPKQTLVAVGKRPQIYDQYIGGLFHLELHDSSNNDIEGEVKIVLSNAPKTRKQIITKKRTAYMNKTSPTDRSKVDLLKLGVNVPFVFAQEDGYIELYFKPDTDGVTIDYDNVNNKLLLDITIRERFAIRYTTI
ncbi:MAG: hypothetical protein QXN36_04080 [Candidatus Bathyarchaeia archaeon]